MCQGLFYVEKGSVVALYRKGPAGQTRFVARVGLIRRMYFQAAGEIGTFADQVRVACHDPSRPDWLVVAPAPAVHRLACEHCDGKGSVPRGRCFACRGKGWLNREDRARHARYLRPGRSVHQEHPWLATAV